MDSSKQIVIKKINDAQYQMLQSQNKFFGHEIPKNNQAVINKEQNIINKEISMLKNGSPNDQSIAKILSHLNLGAVKVSNEDKNAVLVMGNTGAGKTSLTAFISGVDLIVKQTKEDETYIDYQNEDTYRKIGICDVESETLIPNKFIDYKNNLVYWDCPGFSDSRGTEVDIANSFYISSIAEKADKIKFVLVIDSTPFNFTGYGDSRGDTYKQLFETMKCMSQDTRIDFSKHLTIVFTKTMKDLSFYRNKLHKLFDLLSESDSFIDRLKKYFQKNKLTSFFEELKKANIVAFPFPKGELGKIVENIYRDEIRAVIMKSSFYSENKLNIPISVRSLEKVELLWGYTRQKLKLTFDEICNQLGNFLIQLNKEQLGKLEKCISSFDLQYRTKPPSNNIDYFEMIKDLIEESQKLIFSGVSQSVIHQQQNIQNNLEMMEFLLKQVYDGLFNKVTLSKESNQFFGKIGEFELFEGRDHLKKCCETAKHNINNQEKDKCIKDYQKTISNVNSERDYYQSKSKNYESQVNNYESQVNNFQTQISDFKTQVKDYQSKVNDYQSQDNDYKSQVSDYKSQIASMKREKEEYSSNSARERLKQIDEKQKEQVRKAIQEHKTNSEENGTSFITTKSVLSVAGGAASGAGLGYLGAQVGLIGGPIGSLIGGAIGAIGGVIANKVKKCSIF